MNKWPLIDPETVPWWSFLASPETNTSSLRYRILMRSFADPTASATWGVFNPNSEGHQVLNFFEALRLDRQHAWIRSLLNHIGVDGGQILNAEWSYELENAQDTQKELNYRLCDIVVGYTDESGPGLIVIEAKRTSEKLRRGLSPKDDPIERQYLNFSQFNEIDKKHQLLLISEEARASLPSSIQQNRSVITWQEIASLQKEILCFGRTGDARLRKAINSFHMSFGIPDTHDAICLVGDCKAISDAAAERLVSDIDRYWHFLSTGELANVPPELISEPHRSALIEREKQSGADRQLKYWRLGCNLATN